MGFNFKNSDKSFFKIFKVSPGIAYIKSKFMLLNPNFLHKFIFSKASLKSAFLSINFSLSLSNDSIPILNLFTPKFFKSNTNSSFISSKLHSKVNSSKLFLLTLSNILNKLFTSFIFSALGVPPPIYIVLISSPIYLSFISFFKAFRYA